MKPSRRTLRVLLVGLVLGGAFTALGAVSALSWDWSNSSELCATTCHGVHPEQAMAYRRPPIPRSRARNAVSGASPLWRPCSSRPLTWSMHGTCWWVREDGDLAVHGHLQRLLRALRPLGPLHGYVARRAVRPNTG